MLRQNHCFKAGSSITLGDGDAVRAAPRLRRRGRGDERGRRAVPDRERGLVERFDRRGIEPFELFTTEFGQNSFKIQYIFLENSKCQYFSTFSMVFANLRQNFIKL